MIRSMTQATAASLTKIAEGREAEVFAWEPGIVLKLFRRSEWMHLATVELAAMNAVRDAGGPAPRGIEVIDVDGRPGLLMERVDGIDMLTQIGKQPWRVIRAGGIMGRLHATLNTAEAPSAIGNLKDRLSWQISEVARVRADLGERGLAALEALPDDDRLCHGDFHPGNVILTASGPIVIDWPNATRGDAAADVARTLLLLRMGEIPPEAAALIRHLEKVGRWFLNRGYVGAYERSSRVERARIEAWMLPLAIARLSEGITEEHPRLLALIGSLSET
jgi:aminoglycoside phosphotransferase (APT) family kinase protein